MRQVSIIIPTFNSIKYLQETLDSLLAQDFVDFECIVVDDGSGDHTADLVESHALKDNRFQFYKRPPHLPKGPSACRNYGMEKAVGDYLIFLDADDLLASDCLKNRVAEFEKHPDCDFLVFQMARFLEKPDFSITIQKASQDKAIILQSFIQLHSQWPITAPIYRTNFFKSIGFDQKLIVFEDLAAAVGAIVVCRDFKVFEKIDCYYRNDLNYRQKYESVEVKAKMIKAFPVFISGIARLMAQNRGERYKNTTIKSHLARSYKKIFLSVILDNGRIFAEDNKKMLRLLLENHILSRKEALQLKIVHQFLLPFAKIKGSGVSRLIKLFYS